LSVFKFHSPDSAPNGSKKLLEQLLNNSGSNGFYSVISESPEALKAYISLHDLFSKTSFSNEEKTVIWQTINVENECIFCVPAHTSMAKKMNVSQDVNEALRNETPLPTKKLEALVKEKDIINIIKYFFIIDSLYNKRKIFHFE